VCLTWKGERILLGLIDDEEADGRIANGGVSGRTTLCTDSFLADREHIRRTVFSPAHMMALYTDQAIGEDVALCRPIVRTVIANIRPLNGLEIGVSISVQSIGREIVKSYRNSNI